MIPFDYFYFPLWRLKMWEKFPKEKIWPISSHFVTFQSYLFYSCVIILKWRCLPHMPNEWENTKQVFFIVNIIIQWVTKTVELFLLQCRIQKTYISEIYFWISYSQGSYLKIKAVIIISKNKMRTTQFSEYLPFFSFFFFFVLLFYFDDCYRQILINISKVLTN